MGRKVTVPTTVLDFFQSDSESYTFLLDKVRTDIVDLLPLKQRTWGQVKKIEDRYFSGDHIGVYCAVNFFRFDEQTALTRHSADFIHTMAWVKKELEGIASDSEAIVYDTTDEEEIALDTSGVEDLQKYSYLIPLNRLTGGDLTKERSYMKLPYLRVWTELMMQSELSNVRKRYSKKMTKPKKK